MQITQLTTDFTRPAAGANQWNGQNQFPIPTFDAYWRFTWINFQSATAVKGQYDFTAFDAQIKKAIDAGQKFSFGIMQQCGGCDSNLQTHIGGGSLIYPTYLHNLMQAETVKDYIAGGEWFPNYNSPNYISEWKALNVAVNAHILSTTYKNIRYQDVIGQIDCRGYGDYGEWTNNDFSVPAAVATAASLQAIIDGTVQAYPTFQCVYLMATLDANQLSNTKVPVAVGYYALTTSNLKGKLGWRRDSWGQTDSYLSQWTDTNPGSLNGLSFKTEIMNRFKIAPIVGEPQDQGSAGNFASLPAQMAKYGVTSFGNGNFNGATNATIQANFVAASKAAGHRLTITSGSVDGSNVSLNWANNGVAPTYEDWIVNLQLRSGSTIVWTGVSKFLPKLFLPGTAAVSDSFDWSALTGSLDLYVKITDPAGYRKPMPLAIAGQGSDGAYLLQSGIVMSGTGGTNPPPPPPPPPPTIAATNIFGTSAPAGTLLNDGQPLELGIKFKSSSNGFITGIRFYKQSGNSGTHIGELYDSAGKRLAAATFTAETATGWQTVLFASPIAIVSDATYTASYYSPSGAYSDTNNGLSAAVVNSQLTALASGGVYIYSKTPAFPVNTFAASNYWVDVVYSSGGTVVPPPPPANNPPTANVTGTSDIKVASVTGGLDGTSSFDSDGTIVSFAWSKVSGPDGDVITTPGNSQTTVTGLVSGTYIYKLTVADNNGATASKQFTITVHF